MSEKVDWNSLSTTLKSYTTITKKLPAGLYACPRCEGSGRIPLGTRHVGPHPTIMCGMCQGTRIIKRCKICKENPIPHNIPSGMCYECTKARMKHLIELEYRPEIICNFPQWTMNCPNPELQEQNSKGNLVCSLDDCEYSQLKDK